SPGVVWGVRRGSVRRRSGRRPAPRAGGRGLSLRVRRPAGPRPHVAAGVSGRGRGADWWPACAGRAPPPVCGAVMARSDRTTAGGLLRMYWYDAARDRVHTVEQRQIAALPNVKVRLGNLNSAGQQKGVDAQLRQDLELLAMHRAVSDVVLIAGDEDMVAAVGAAAAHGVT